MDKAGIVLRVFFEDPFWIIWVEVYVGDQQMVSRNVIPKEFNDQEVYNWIMLHYHHLSFCSAGSVEKAVVHKNPKRSIRQIAKQMKEPGISTKAQKAYQISRELAAQKQEKLHHEQHQLSLEERFEKKTAKKEKKASGKITLMLSYL